MKDELITFVEQKTGISQDDARKAVEVIVSTLKSKLPGPIVSHLDSFISGGASGGTSALTGARRRPFSSMCLWVAQQESRHHGTGSRPTARDRVRAFFCDRNFERRLSGGPSRAPRCSMRSDRYRN